MVNYLNSKVLTIRNRVNSKVFVCSTSNRLCEAFNNYKQQYKKGIRNKPLLKAFDDLGIDKFYTVIEEEVKCYNKDVINERINFYINKYNSIDDGYNYVRMYKRKDEAQTSQRSPPQDNQTSPPQDNQTSPPQDNQTSPYYKMPKGVHLTTLRFLDDEYPLKRLLIMREIAKQIIDRDITATREVLETLKRNVSMFFS